MKPIAILTEGKTEPIGAKTAVALLRYRGDEVAALIDSTAPGNKAPGSTAPGSEAPGSTAPGITAGELLGAGGNTPVVASVEAAAGLVEGGLVEGGAVEAGAGHLVIGVATPGGGLPESMRAAVLDAARRGWSITSGLHQFLNDDPEIAAAARQSGAVLTDLRRNTERVIADRQGLRSDCLRLHTVGQDCSCGKMVASVELARGLQAAGQDAKFIPTGQTGILVAPAPGINGRLTMTDDERADPMAGGCPVDAVVADFINGAAERLVKRNQHHDILIIEGQASLVHPSYSSVTYGLLHGTLPHGLILCYEPGRPHLLGRPHLPLTPLATVRKLYELVSNLEQECRFIGVAMSSRLLPDDAAIEAERERVSNALDLPVCDVYRDGAEVLVEAALRLQLDVMP